MTALALLQQLYELGVILTPYPDGTVRCRASKGVLTPALIDVMRHYKEELHALQVKTRTPTHNTLRLLADCAGG